MIPMTSTAPNLPAARAVLADDVRLMRDQLRARLAEVWPDLNIVAEAKNGLEAVELVQEHRPDVVFLDIRMPGMTGVQAACKRRVKSPKWKPPITKPCLRSCSSRLTISTLWKPLNKGLRTTS